MAEETVGAIRELTQGNPGRPSTAFETSDGVIKAIGTKTGKMTRPLKKKELKKEGVIAQIQRKNQTGHGSKKRKKTHRLEGAAKMLREVEGEKA